MFDVPLCAASHWVWCRIHHVFIRHHSQPCGKGYMQHMYIKVHTKHEQTITWGSPTQKQLAYWYKFVWLLTLTLTNLHTPSLGEGWCHDFSWFFLVDSPAKTKSHNLCSKAWLGTLSQQPWFDLKQLRIPIRLRNDEPNRRIGKPHRKMLVWWDLELIYALVNVYITMANHPFFFMGNLTCLWEFPIAMLVITRDILGVKILVSVRPWHHRFFVSSNHCCCFYCCGPPVVCRAAVCCGPVGYLRHQRQRWNPGTKRRATRWGQWVSQKLEG